MRIFLSLALFSTLLFCESITPSKSDTNTTQVSAVKCHCVCDKKISKVEKLSKAIEFYKNSTVYKFPN